MCLIRGNIQSPFGNLARMMTVPYLNENLFFEFNLHDSTGGIMRKCLLSRKHSCGCLLVQLN